jgi:hypothetical protein
MNLRIAAALALASLSLISCAKRTVAPTSFAPAYKTMLDPSDVAVARSCATASSVEVRSQMSGNRVGQRSPERNPANSQPIRMEGSPIPWVAASAKAMFAKSAIETGEAGAPGVVLGLQQVQINENVYVNAGYDARVVIDATVLDGRGQPCWTARKTGFAQNYGYAGSTAAYRETVDHALDRAIMGIAADDGFQNALCSKCRK